MYDVAEDVMLALDVKCKPEVYVVACKMYCEVGMVIAL
jgi:hypothetical protein